MFDKYKNADAAKLKNALQELYDKLEDTENMRMAVLGQTGHHVPGNSVKKFAVQISSLESEIEAVKRALSALPGT